MAKKEFIIGEIGTAKKQVLQAQKQNIVILQELKEIIPSLQTVEYEQLEANILSEGCREALILWEHGEQYILIDGHNRYEICQKHGIDFSVKVMAFEYIEQVKLWMYDNQLGRRNLSNEQASYLRGKKYHAKKMISGTRTDLTQNLRKVERTDNMLAQEYGVSPRTIINDAQFAQAIDKIGEVNPELKRNILSGKTKITKSQVQEIAKMENLLMLEDIEDLENLFHSSKNPQAKNEFSEKTKVEVLKQKLHKIFKSKLSDTF
ncbi:MAG: hypothetical protein EAZ97_01475 [Bacteroidetes bacterium]|nr:MAG: hypothetical protein EAZ97_01475 [Bacteroidota bacterium]